MENLGNTSLDEAKIQQFIARGKELGKSRDEIKSSYDKALSDGFFNKSGVNIQQPQPEKQSFLGGVAEKTGESFQKGISRIGEAGVGLAEGKYNIPEAFSRGGAGALQVATSPIAGVLGETIETGVENIPQSFKDYIGKKTQPTIQDAKDFRASQTPYQKRQLENAGVGLEILANFVGLNYAKKGLQAGKEAVKETVGEGFEQGVKNVKEGLGNIKMNFSQKAKESMGGIDNVSSGMESEGNLFSKVKEKLQSKITPERPVEDIAANILQPYKGVAENLDDASRGLQRVINESETPVDTSDFKELLNKTLPVQEKYGKMLDNELKTIQGLKQSDSADNALTQLKQIYQGVLSKKDKSTLDRVKQLQEKNINGGLTASEINEIKILHTKANNLFNEKGQTTGGFSSDDLRNIRSELKQEVENMGEAEGITNIREINKAYGELSDTRMLLENQINNVKAFKGRELPETLSQKIGTIIGKIPLIKGGLQGLFKEAGISLKAGKINPIEVQKRLPELLKELRKAGVKEGQIKQIQLELSKEFLFPKPKLALPAGRGVQEVKTIIGPQKSPIKTPYGKVGKTPVQPEGTPTTPIVAIKKPQLTLPPGKVITPQTAEKGVIIESKKGLPVQSEIKSQLEKTLQNVNTSNIAKVTSEVAKILNTTKKVEVKAIIRKYMRQFGEDFKNKISDLIDEIAEKVGAKINLMPSKVEKQVGIKSIGKIGADKTKLLKPSDKGLIEEAKKYNSAEEFIDSIFNKRAEKQRGWSAPSGKGETLEDRLSYDGDVTLREELTKHIKQPDDYFHGYLGPKKYGNDSNTITAIKNGMSEGEITIYRAVPKNINTWRDGDWVYFVKDKAKIHGDISLDGNYHIIEKKVPIDDVWWDGNDINEWGYDSGLEKAQLKQIYEKAHKVK